jgi:hypothetical protein
MRETPKNAIFGNSRGIPPEQKKKLKFNIKLDLLLIIPAHVYTYGKLN